MVMKTEDMTEVAEEEDVPEEVIVDVEVEEIRDGTIILIRTIDIQKSVIIVTSQDILQINVPLRKKKWQQKQKGPMPSQRARRSSACPQWTSTPSLVRGFLT